MSIERGERSWGTRDDYRQFEPAILYHNRLTQDDSAGSEGGKPKPKFPRDPYSKGLERKRFYCRDFQTRACSLPYKHEGPMGKEGTIVTLEHFCRACFNRLSKFEPHSEADNACPLRKA